MRALLAASVLFATAAAAPSPGAVLSKLLATPFKAGELPAGVSASRPARIALTANGRKYKALGTVSIVLKGPDPDDGIIYEVFPDSAHALADLHHPALPATAHNAGPAAGVKQSIVLVGTLTGKNANGATVTIGFTDVAAVSGNVLIQALAGSATSKTHGDTTVAVELLRAALKHLQQLDRLPA